MRHLGAQPVVHLLLFLTEEDGVVCLRNVAEQVQDLVHLPLLQHALFAQVIQHSAAQAQLSQRTLGQRAALQRRHCRLLLGGGLWLFGQRPCKGIFRLGVAHQLLLQPGAVFRFRRFVLGPIGDDGLDRLVPGAEGALLQKAHQTQQLVGEAGVFRRCVEQLLAAARLLLLTHSQHNAHAGLVAPAEGHQHHAPRNHRMGQCGGHKIGIELIKMKRGAAYCHLDCLQHRAALPSARRVRVTLLPADISESGRKSPRHTRPRYR